jgi:hypothetical protein
MSEKFRFYSDRNFLYRYRVQKDDYRETLANAVIPNPLTPFKDELFSSWIARLSAKFDCQVSTFLNIYFPFLRDKRLTARDMDLVLDSELAEIFSQKTRISKTIIYNAGLRSYESYLSETIRDNSRNNLISTVKIKGSYSKSHGLKYCPYCLRENNYFKKQWRLLFVNVCEKHNCYFLDRCPSCNNPITTTKRKKGIKFFNCPFCGFEFHKAESEKLPSQSNAVENQKKMLEILNNGYFIFENKPYYSIFYFWVVKKLAKLIYLDEYRKNDTLQTEIELHNYPLKSKKEIKSRFIEDFLELKEGISLFTAIYDILKNRESFDKFVKDNNLSFYILNTFKEGSDYNPPYWYIDLISNYQVGASHQIVTEEMIRNAVKWMQKNGIRVSLRNLAKWTGIDFCSNKKAKVLKKILEDNKT